MKENLLPQFEKEIEKTINQFVDMGWNQIDEMAIEKNIKININPGSLERFSDTLILVFYHKLLTYIEGDKGKREYVAIPWITCKFELENGGDKDFLYSETVKELVNYIKKELESIGISAFKDEDAPHQMFSNRCRTADRNGYVTFEFFINPDYPKGYWSNHTL